MQKVLFIAVIVSYAVALNAQRPATGIWFTANTPVSLSPKWEWHNDASYRTLGASARPLQYLYRTGVRYRFSEIFNAAAGVALFATKTDFNKAHHEFGNEFRIWQELLYQQRKNKWQWLVRLRTEQRSFAATSRKPAYNAFRYRIKGSITRMLSDKLGLQLAGEYMQQGQNGNYAFDQNRIMLLGVVQLNKTSQLQPGYMWLKWPDADQHILMITLLKNIKLYDGKGEKK